MNNPKFQQHVGEFVNRFDLATSTHIRVLDLVSEVGEIAKEYLQESAYGQRPFQPGENWPNELGDAFFSLICIANQTKVDLGTALYDALEKYEQRIRQKGTADSTDGQSLKPRHESI